MDTSRNAWMALRGRFERAADDHWPLYHVLRFAPDDEQATLDPRRYAPPLLKPVGGERGDWVQANDGPEKYPIVSGSGGGIARHGAGRRRSLCYAGHFYWRRELRTLDDPAVGDALARWKPLAADASIMLGTMLPTLGHQIGHDALIDTATATSFGDERWLLALHLLGARGEGDALRAERLVASGHGFNSLGTSQPGPGSCSYLLPDVFMASVYAIDVILELIDARDRRPASQITAVARPVVVSGAFGAELLALEQLGKRELWGIDELPEWADLDMLRCLDDRGWVDARFVTMQNTARHPGDPWTPAPSSWFSPLQAPSMAGPWETLVRKRTRDERTHPAEVRVSERGRVELARMRRAGLPVRDPERPSPASVPVVEPKTDRETADRGLAVEHIRAWFQGKSEARAWIRDMLKEGVCVGLTDDSFVTDAGDANAVRALTPEVRLLIACDVVAGAHDDGYVDPIWERPLGEWGTHTDDADVLEARAYDAAAAMSASRARTLGAVELRGYLALVLRAWEDRTKRGGLINGEINGGDSAQTGSTLVGESKRRKLTPGETRVWDALQNQGHTPEALALILNTSNGTIRQHVTDIRRKRGDDAIAIRSGVYYRPDAEPQWKSVLVTRKRRMRIR